MVLDLKYKVQSFALDVPFGDQLSMELVDGLFGLWELLGGDVHSFDLLQCR